MAVSLTTFSLRPLFKPLFLAATLTSLLACGDSVTSAAGSQFNGGNVDQGDNNSGGDTGNGNSSDFDKTKLLNDLVEQVFVPAVNDFQQASTEHATAVAAYCSDLKTQQVSDADLLQTAKSSWQVSMSAWQQLEVMQIGPLLNNDAQLRNEIYSWPVTNQCAVDQDVGFNEAGTVAGGEYDISKRTSTRRGLDAQEYLLFNTDLNHACANDSQAPQNWNQRPDIERKIARCEYSVEVANDLLNSANELADAWLSGGTNSYAEILKTAATNGQFDSVDAAINRVTDALFYVDKITKDAKLGAPVGLINNSCGTATCVNDIESRLSAHSLQNIRANIVAMQRVFKGGSSDTDVGFDDYLVAVDASELAVTMATDIQAMIDAIDSFEGEFEAAVVNEPAKVQALYQDIKKVTDNLKSAFITFLSLQLPASSAGDAD